MALPDSIHQRYEVLGEAGRGGMGVVYKARDRQTNELVALKVIKSDLVEDASVTERFKNELRLARKVTHKNVCRIYEINFAGEIPYISMEFVEGETVRALLKRVGSLNLQTAVRMAGQMCAALGEAHKQGIIYRDLKPENVMVDRAGDIKVLDFGIARSFDGTTTVGQLVGSPAYMAPEQIRGTTVDRRTDIYALGLVMYEMFTGMPAHRANSDVAALLEGLQRPLVPPRQIEPRIPDTIERIILRCLEKDPIRRFQTVDEVRQSLDTFRDSTVQSTTVRRTLLPRSSDFVMRRRVAKGWLLFIEFGYIVIYGATLYYIDSVAAIFDRDLLLSSPTALPWVIAAAMCGIAVRIYLLSALLLDHPALTRKFPRLFPALFVLDSAWAAVPLLLLHKITWGLTLAFVAALAYLPFAQRTLIQHISPEKPLQ
jgi:serine/threonine protein kinase